MSLRCGTGNTESDFAKGVIFMQISLTDWQLAGYLPFYPFYAYHEELGKGLGCVTPVIPAKVPGSVYLDLFRAGLISDPFYEQNSLLCEWVKDRFWIYETTFCPTHTEAENAEDRVFLHLSGIDCRAHIFVNREKVGEHENMFTPFDADVTALVRFSEENTVRIVLESAPDEMGQIGYTDRMHTQKARYTYKWDFGTRLVGMGLWQEAHIEVLPGARIGETEAVWDGRELTYRAMLDRPCCVTFLLSRNRRVIADHEEYIAGGEYRHTVKIEDPDLWYPNGAGDQPLYEIDLLVSSGVGDVSDQKHTRIGLRTLSYRRCAGSSEDSLPYVPVINQKPIFLKGVNCVPMELMTGTESAEQRKKMLQLIRDMGCNLVRVWGGGVIECEEFYDLCDEYGIMVWQEMPQSSSGISNVPSHDPHYLSLLKQTAREAAVSRRNHVCLTFFGGGNELTDEQGRPATFADPNLAMLHSVLHAHAPLIQVLPTSPSGPSACQTAEPGANHDIHGPWKYGGTEGHYTQCNSCTAQLHSEFGCDGMTNEAMLPLFLAPENRKTIETVAENLTWRHHGEWWDTYAYRDCSIFGEMGGDLSTYITVSQYMQAESLRYTIESNRRRQWQCGGTIIWQFNEPWPGISGTNLVDHSLTPKLAYYFCADAFAPFHVSLRYSKLLWQEGEVFSGSVFLHDEAADVPAARIREGGGRLTVTLLDSHGIPAASFENGSFSFLVARLGSSFRLRLVYEADGRCCENCYLFFVLRGEEKTASVEAVRRFVRRYEKRLAREREERNGVE